MCVCVCESARAHARFWGLPASDTDFDIARARSGWLIKDQPTYGPKPNLSRSLAPTPTYIPNPMTLPVPDPSPQANNYPSRMTLLPIRMAPLPNAMALLP